MTFHVTEMRMLRWARGHTRLDQVRNVLERDKRVPVFLRKKRLRRFGHVKRRYKDEATRKTSQTTVDGKLNRGRPKLRWRLGLVKDCML